MDRAEAAVGLKYGDPLVAITLASALTDARPLLPTTTSSLREC